MKVSILIPAYNEEKYIAKTLTAVLAQDYSDFEIIVINNNSSDKTKEIVKQFNSPKLKLIEEKKAGVQFAREAGRLESRGEFIGNLDADCIPPPNWITNCLKYLKNPKVVAVSGPYEYYDAKTSFRVSTLLTQKIGYNFFYKLLYLIFRRGVGMTGGNAMIRASALEKIGGYNTSITFYGDDTDTSKRLGKIGRVLFKNRITIKSSSRRFKTIGKASVAWNYFINYLWVTIFDRPYNQEKNDLEKIRKCKEGDF